MAETEIKVIPARWGEAQAGYLKLSVSGVSLDDLKSQVEAGARLFDVLADDIHVGTFMLRVDVRGSGSDGVIVAAGGRLSGFDFTYDLLPVVEQMFFGVDRIRIHTERGGMAKKLQKSGYMLREVVYVKELEK